MQHSASATAMPPSAMSWALRERAGADAVADRGVGLAHRLGDRAPAARPTGARPWSLASSEPARLRLEGTDERDRVARPGEAEPSGPGGIGQPADETDHRGGEDRAGRRLVVERDVAADHRDPERLAGPGEALDRLGSAARRRAASPGCRSSGSWSARAARRRRRRGWRRTRTPPRPRRRAGSQATRRPLPSIATAIAGAARAASARPRRPARAGAPCATARPGRTARTRPGARRCSAEPQQRQQHLRRRLGAGQDRGRGAGRARCSGGSGCEVVERAVVDQHRGRTARRRRCRAGGSAACRSR